VLNECFTFELCFNSFLIVLILRINSIKYFQIVFLSLLKGGGKFEKTLFTLRKGFNQVKKVVRWLHRTTMKCEIQVVNYGSYKVKPAYPTKNTALAFQSSRTTKLVSLSQKTNHREAGFPTSHEKRPISGFPFSGNRRNSRCACKPDGFRFGEQEEMVRHLRSAGISILLCKPVLKPALCPRQVSTPLRSRQTGIASRAVRVMLRGEIAH